jgi:salicylate hydroxylase
MLTWHQVGAGIRIPPNSSRILAQYGLKDQFLQKVVWPQHFAFRRYATGQLLGTTPLHPLLSGKYGSPYWLIHRADFQAILFDAAKAVGVDIRLGCYVVSVDVSGPRAMLASGETLQGDVVIGADGIRSPTRKALLGPRNVEAAPTGQPSRSKSCRRTRTQPT